MSKVNKKMLDPSIYIYIYIYMLSSKYSLSHDRAQLGREVNFGFVGEEADFGFRHICFCILKIFLKKYIFFKFFLLTLN